MTLRIYLFIYIFYLCIYLFILPNIKLFNKLIYLIFKNDENQRLKVHKETSRVFYKVQFFTQNYYSPYNIPLSQKQIPEAQCLQKPQRFINKAQISTQLIRRFNSLSQNNHLDSTYPCYNKKNQRLKAHIETSRVYLFIRFNFDYFSDLFVFSTTRTRGSRPT